MFQLLGEWCKLYATRCVFVTNAVLLNLSEIIHDELQKD
jgi:hypothetical protein